MLYMIIIFLKEEKNKIKNNKREEKKKELCTKESLNIYVECIESFLQAT